MKKIIIGLSFILSTSFSFAEPLRMDKGSYSKYMYLLLDCLTRSGLQTDFKVADLAMDHCVSEANVGSRVSMVYDFTPSVIMAELDQYHFIVRDMLACLGGDRGKKTSSDESTQSANDQRVIKECRDIVDPAAAGLQQSFTQ